MIRDHDLRFYIFLIIGVGIISAFFHGLGLSTLLPWNVVYSDALGFFEKAAAPGFPYLDKLIEYPVLTGIFIQFMEIIGRSRAGYYLFTAAALISLGALATYFLFQIIPEHRRKRFFTYWIFAPSMFIFLVFNWDIIAILFTVIAFYFMQKNKNYYASFFLAMGFCSKFFPILYLAPLLLKQKSTKEWFKIIAVFLGSIFLVNIFFAVSNFEGWSYFFTLNSIRNSNPDSIWTLIRLYGYNFSITQINFISLFLFSSSYLLVMARFRKAPIEILCFIATILFLLFNKVFSPQYVLWLLPFFVICPIQIKKFFYTLEFSNLIAFFAILPWFFTKNTNYFYISAPFVLIRHISLIFILIKAINFAKIFDSAPKNLRW